MYLTLECRYLKGCDITWAHAHGPAVMDLDYAEEDDAGEGIMGNGDSDTDNAGQTNAAPALPNT
jgi:hypothetical protein